MRRNGGKRKKRSWKRRNGGKRKKSGSYSNLVR